MEFNNLSLHPKILKAVNKVGYSSPTEIQKETIPQIIKGVDVQACSHTGTGKTAAFLLPAFNHLVTSPNHKKRFGARILILVPTRELAMQIKYQAQKYGKTVPHIKSVCIYGGVPYRSQIGELSRPYDILIATPGRLIDFVDQKKIGFSSVEMLILDEADRMLDKGFLEPVEKIARATPNARQTLLFSATLQQEVIDFSKRLLKDPIEIKLEPRLEQSGKIKQSIHFVDNLNHKDRLLDHLLKQKERGDTIIFTSTKKGADRLAKDLHDKRHLVGALHGNISQHRRSKILSRMRRGDIQILVATDIAARGIDIHSITHVINYDLPFNVCDYVHRIGRTGRAGKEGFACSFVGNRDRKAIKKIKQFTGQPIDVATVPGLEPSVRKQGSKPINKLSVKKGLKSTNNRSFRKQGSKPTNKRGRIKKR